MMFLKSNRSGILMMFEGLQISAQVVDLLKTRNVWKEFFSCMQQNANPLHRLQGQLHIGVFMIRRLCRRSSIIVFMTRRLRRRSSILVLSRVHLLNWWRGNKGHRIGSIIRQVVPHLPVLLTQSTPVHAAVHQAWITG